MRPASVTIEHHNVTFTAGTSVRASDNNQSATVLYEGDDNWHVCVPMPSVISSRHSAYLTAWGPSGTSSRSRTIFFSNTVDSEEKTFSTKENVSHAKRIT